MTENELREKVCARARAWLGLREADGSFRPIIDAYNAIRPLPVGYRMTYTDPWCAAFVSAVGAVCGAGAALLPECSCERMVELYREKDRFEAADEMLPRPGDLVFYDWDGSGKAQHVGLVCSVLGNLISTVEGNLSDAVGERRMHLDSPLILGYARPDYASQCGMMNSECEIADVASAGEELAPPAASPTTAPVAPSIARQETPPPATPSNSEFQIPNSELFALPVLRRGDAGETVRAAQLLLIGRGYRCGPWGADGDFGSATYGAVYRFQRARRLAADGLVGPDTWTQLITLAGKETS